MNTSDSGFDNAFGGYLPANLHRYGCLDEDSFLASCHGQSALWGGGFLLMPDALGPCLQDPYSLYQQVLPSLPAQGGDDLYLVTVTDSSLATLADQLSRAGVRVLRLQDNTDRNSLINEISALAAPGSLGRLHVISHGQSNQLVLGGTVLTSRNVGRNADWLRQLGSFLAEDGDILLYGCNLAADAAGQRLVRRLADLTGADVAASTNVTFEDAISHRSDWTLEDSVGSIAPGYQDLLTGFDWTGQLGSSALFNNGTLSILGASGSFSISGDLGAANTGTVKLTGSINDEITVNSLNSIKVEGQDYGHLEKS